MTHESERAAASGDGAAGPVPGPFWTSDAAGITLYRGDNADVLRVLPDQSVHAVVTDPPYGIAFMGRRWDRFTDGAAFEDWCGDWTREVLRVIKPGGHILAFGSTRTWHRLAAGLEDAGAEIRDTIMWVYGSGLPKGINVARSIDKMLGAEGTGPGSDYVPATREAARWAGWSSALKPAWDPVVVARRPLEGTVAGNMLRHGTGGINIAACRVPVAGQRLVRVRTGHEVRRPSSTRSCYRPGLGDTCGEAAFTSQGRWPPNVLLGHADGCRPAGGGRGPAGTGPGRGRRGAAGTGPGGGRGGRPRGPAVPGGREEIRAWECVPGCPVAVLEAQCEGAARYFPTFVYEPKAPRSERPRLARKVMRLRAGLTGEQRAYVLEELRKAGVDAG